MPLFLLSFLLSTRVGNCEVKLPVLSAVASLACFVTMPLRAQDSYDLLRLGFFDAEHTARSGFQTSSVSALDANFAAGTSRRFNGESFFNPAGSTAWATDLETGQTARIGFVDATHTAIDGKRDSEVFGFTPGGRAVGTSYRYGIGDGDGRTAWIANPATAATTAVGLFGAEFTRASGEHTSFIQFWNSADFVAGQTSRFSGS